MSSDEDLVANVLAALGGTEIKCGLPEDFIIDRRFAAEEKERHRQRLVKSIEVALNRELRKWADERGLPAPVISFVEE